ncbi:MAG: hypothetical protein WCI43_01400 [Candidatus Firestonebacteria bacterium]
MKKFLMLLVIAAVVIGLSVPASAGKMGVGYSNSGTPLGVKMWLTDSFGLDAAIGYNSAAASQNVGIEVAVDMVMAKVDTVQFQLRGGMAMNFGLVTNLYWPLGFNIEYYVAKNLSLNLGMGVQFAVENAVFRFSTFCNTTGGLGVYYYF